MGRADDSMNVKIHGCRGSIPVSQNSASKYGGNTSCMVLETSGQILILDAGNGLIQVNEWIKKAQVDKTLNILLSHLHLDHLIGLPVFSHVWDSDNCVRIYTCDRDKRPLKEQIFGMFVPPYWPASMVHSANAECIAIKANVAFEIGPITITPFSAAHPDDTVSFHINDGDKTVVHLLDSEISMLNKQQYDTLVSYCRNADLVIFDAAYSPADYPAKKGWGHSTIEDGFKLAKDSGCKKMIFSHFSFEYGDQELEALEALAKAQGDKFTFASDGMELCL